MVTFFATTLLHCNGLYPIISLEGLLSREKKQKSFWHFWTPSWCSFLLLIGISLLCEKCLSHSTRFVPRTVIFYHMWFLRDQQPHTKIKPVPKLCSSYIINNRKIKNSVLTLLSALFIDNKMQKIGDGITHKGPIKNNYK